MLETDGRCAARNQRDEDSLMHKEWRINELVNAWRGHDGVVCGRRQCDGDGGRVELGIGQRQIGNRRIDGCSPDVLGSHCGFVACNGCGLIPCWLCGWRR